MIAIVLFMALGSTSALADEYTPVDWIQVTEGGGVALTFETPGYLGRLSVHLLAAGL